MAASALRTYRYVHRDLSRGNLARDLDWVVRERELDRAGTAPVEQPRVRRQEAAAVREVQRVSLPAVLGVLGLLSVSVLLLLSYVELTTLSAGTVALKEDLAALEAQHVVLTAAYEQMFDMAAVREAAAAAGMSRPTGSQVCYLDMANEDSVVICSLQDQSVLERILSSLHSGVYAVVEYFH